MSNFVCEYCGTPILERDNGEYMTECKHYPKEPTRISPIYKQHQLLDQLVAEGQRYGLYDEAY